MRMNNCVMSAVCSCGQDELRKRARELVSKSDTYRQTVEKNIEPIRDTLKDDLKINVNVKELIVNARAEFGYG